MFLNLLTLAHALVFLVVGFSAVVTTSNANALVLYYTAHGDGFKRRTRNFKFYTDKRPFPPTHMHGLLTTSLEQVQDRCLQSMHHLLLKCTIFYHQELRHCKPPLPHQPETAAHNSLYVPSGLLLGVHLTYTWPVVDLNKKKELTFYQHMLTNGQSRLCIINVLRCDKVNNVRLTIEVSK